MSQPQWSWRFTPPCCVWLYSIADAVTTVWLPASAVGAWLII